jgi:hypothetical protein
VAYGAVFVLLMVLRVWTSRRQQAASSVRRAA